MNVYGRIQQMAHDLLGTPSPLSLHRQIRTYDAKGRLTPATLSTVLLAARRTRQWHNALRIMHYCKNEAAFPLGVEHYQLALRCGIHPFLLARTLFPVLPAELRSKTNRTTSTELPPLLPESPTISPQSPDTTTAADMLKTLSHEFQISHPYPPHLVSLSFPLPSHRSHTLLAYYHRQGVLHSAADVAAYQAYLSETTTATTTSSFVQNRSTENPIDLNAPLTARLHTAWPYWKRLRTALLQLQQRNKYYASSFEAKEGKAPMNGLEGKLQRMGRWPQPSESVGDAKGSIHSTNLGNNKKAFLAHLSREVFVAYEPLMKSWLYRLHTHHLLGIQSLSSVLATALLGARIRPGSFVLDLCAAPGNKALRLAECLGRRGVLVVNDKNSPRRGDLEKRLSLAPFPQVLLTQYDAQHFPLVRVQPEEERGEEKTASKDITVLGNNVVPQHDRWSSNPLTLSQTVEPSGSFFDFVLADVPCSGDGRMGHDVHLNATWRPFEGVTLFNTQRAILSRALRLVHVGGSVLYSTCSLNPVENEAVVASVLREYAGSVELRHVNLPSSFSGVCLRPGLRRWCVPHYAENRTESDKHRGHLKRFVSAIEEVAWDSPLRTISNFTELFCSASDNLEQCARLLPHENRSFKTGFFFALFQKVAPSTTPEEQVLERPFPDKCPASTFDEAFSNQVLYPFTVLPNLFHYYTFCKNNDGSWSAMTKEASWFQQNIENGGHRKSREAQSMSLAIKRAQKPAAVCVVTQKDGRTLNIIGAQLLAPYLGSSRVIQLPPEAMDYLIRNSYIDARFFCDYYGEMRNSYDASMENAGHGAHLPLPPLTELEWAQSLEPVRSKAPSGLDSSLPSSTSSSSSSSLKTELSGPLLVTTTGGTFHGVYLSCKLQIRSEEKIKQDSKFVSQDAVAQGLDRKEYWVIQAELTSDESKRLCALSDTISSSLALSNPELRPAEKKQTVNILDKTLKPTRRASYLERSSMPGNTENIFSPTVLSEMKEARRVLSQ